MWYICRCGCYQKQAPNYRSNITKTAICIDCRSIKVARLTERIQIFSSFIRRKKNNRALHSPHGGIGRRNGLKIRR